MKVWTSYSSEHSARIRIIGRFKTKDDLASFEKSFEQMQELVKKHYDECLDVPDKFPQAILACIGSGAIKHTETLAASDMLDFANEMDVMSGAEEVVIKSNECNWSGVIKMLIGAGARIEMFSEHNHPESDADKT